MFSKVLSHYALVAAVASIAFVASTAAQADDTNNTSPWQPPPQGLSRQTGYTAWHGMRDGWDFQILDGVTLWSALGTVFGGFLALRYGHLGTDLSRLSKHQRAQRMLTAVIAWYTFVTSFAVLGFFLLDISKLWSALGAIHNLLEVTILLVLLFEGHPKEFKYLYTLQFVYISLTVFVCLILPWPIDALFFKFQGLATDYMLVFQFIRLYRVNKAAEYIPHGPRRGEAARLINEVESELGRVAIGDTVEEEPVEDEHRLETENIRLLIAAAAVHLFGNILTSIFDTFWPFIIFQFTYGVTYPLYGFYVFRQPPVPHTELKWVKARTSTEIGLGIISVTLSAFTVGFGIFLNFLNR